MNIVRGFHSLLPANTSTLNKVQEQQFLNMCDGENSKQERMRYALLGDAILRLVAVNKLLHKRPDASNGDITLILDQVLTNSRMELYMAEQGIDLEGLPGKRAGDTFEAWIGWCAHKLLVSKPIEDTKYIVRNYLDHCMITVKERYDTDTIYTSDPDTTGVSPQ